MRSTTNPPSGTGTIPPPPPVPSRPDEPSTFRRPHIVTIAAAMLFAGAGILGFFAALVVVPEQPDVGILELAVALVVLVVAQQLLDLKRWAWWGAVLASAVAVVALAISFVRTLVENPPQPGDAGMLALTLLFYFGPPVFVVAVLWRHRNRFDRELVSADLPPHSKGSLVSGAVGSGLGALGYFSGIMGGGFDIAAAVLGVVAIMLGAASVPRAAAGTRANRQAWVGVVLGVLAIGLAALALYTVQSYCSTNDCTM